MDGPYGTADRASARPLFFYSTRGPTFRLNCDSRVLPLAHTLTTEHIMPELLNAQDIKDWLKKLPEWELEKKHIERLFEFDDFAQSIDFVNQVADIAEDEEHHPDIDIRYNKVKISLSTHSEGGITDLDFEIAEKIDTLVDE
jgi:4a-hydroxytetrahydrobiopterin dehydratase